MGLLLWPAAAAGAVGLFRAVVNVAVFEILSSPQFRAQIRISYGVAFTRDDCRWLLKCRATSTPVSICLSEYGTDPAQNPLTLILLNPGLSKISIYITETNLNAMVL